MLTKHEQIERRRIIPFCEPWGRTKWPLRRTTPYRCAWRIFFMKYKLKLWSSILNRQIQWRLGRYSIVSGVESLLNLIWGGFYERRLDFWEYLGFNRIDRIVSIKVIENPFFCVVNMNYRLNVMKIIYSIE